MMQQEVQPDPSIDLERTWQNVLRSVGVQMGDWARNAYLDNLVPVGMDGSVFAVSASNEFARSRLEDRFTDLFESAVSDELRRTVRVRFVLSRPKNGLSAEPVPAEEPVPSSQLEQPTTAARQDVFASLALNPRYTFDTFVVGSSNRLAHAAGLNVANSPGRTYNPLFIYGGVGLGKTHLMHAIGHLASEQSTDYRVVYISGETFLNHVVSAIREGRTEVFRQWYRTVDLWLVDDIQFIASKEQSRTEAEFFHTFNALHETDKQIVVSSDRPPRDLQIMDDRLRSRFEMGLLTDISTPDEETRFAILQRKAQLENTPVPNEVLGYIASIIRSNVRALEGALTRVIASASLAGNEITLELARDWLMDFTVRDGYQKTTPRQVRDIVSRHFGLKAEELTGKRRDRAVVLPRQIAMFLARDLGDVSSVQIGAVFGGRDHSTVLHACAKISGLIESDAEMARLVDDIRADIQSHDAASH